MNTFKIYSEMTEEEKEMKRERVRRYSKTEKGKLIRKGIYERRKVYKNLLIPTNAEKNEGYEKHHINKTFVISLPFFIHRQVPHGIDILYTGMEEINEIALNFLLSGV